VKVGANERGGGGGKSGKGDMVGDGNGNGGLLLGVVAMEDVPKHTKIITRALSAPAYDAEYARADDKFGAGTAISRYEDEVKRRVNDDTALSVMLTLAKRHSSEGQSVLGAYARALPSLKADTPVLYMDEALEALVPMLSLNVVDQIDIARGEFALALDDAKGIFSKIVSPSPASHAVLGGHSMEPPLNDDEFAWAWSMVRSRAITFAVRKASV
jgi:hypothetical protein